MNKINLLSEETINKIAAGEVVERPASVVKELVENSLDAGATKITINIEDSGKKLIKIQDNGIGMTKEDTEKCILRHATSKITNSEDLFCIDSLGFRGEALASIAAVSQFSIITKQESEIEGFNLVVDGGVVVSSGIMASERGTVVEVQNLFYNTPARRNFLKTDSVELRHIIDIITRYALINNAISFSLIHEGHALLQSPSVEDIRSNIASIYGINVAKELLKIYYFDENLKLYGYIAKPAQARNDKIQQSLFVNKRWVKSDDVSCAVYDAFHSMLFVNKHPIYVLNIEINPKKIDVNVHPNKLEIKFEQSELIYKAVFTAIKQTLEKNNLIPVINFQEDQQATFGTPIKKQILNEPKYKFEPSSQEILSNKAETIIASDKVIPLESLDREEPEMPAQSINSTQNDKIPIMKILGQIHKTFFVAETFGGAFFIDQHAAHERVLYEKFMKQYMDKGVQVQRLLQNEIMDFSPTEKVLIEEHKKTLTKFGFTIYEFGDNSYMIKTIPLIFGRLQPKEILYEVLTMLKEGKEKIIETKEEIVTRMACRSAIMAGEEITNLQMEGILKDLSETQHPYTCPHGRPTIIKTTADELEKKFKRK
jgi:DNA mismatch repair protein MutL